MEIRGDYSALGVLWTIFDLGREALGLEGLFHLTIGTKFIEEMDRRCEGKPIAFEILAVTTGF